MAEGTPSTHGIMIKLINIGESIENSIMNDSLSELIEKAAEFRDARNWKQFHNPKDLAISISLEAAELLETFQWSGSDVEADTETKIAKIKEELADVLLYSFLMADVLDLNIPEIISHKIEQNAKKYPVDKAFGRADKYTAYISDGDKINDSI